MSKNTFGDYKFEEWIPEDQQESIRSFWGWADRTYLDWIENGKSSASDACTHGPGPNGFKNPNYGDTADYIIRDYKLSKDNGYDIYKIVRGKYFHAWNNMGRLIDENGETHYVSSCDRWVRVYI
jgi:hypothetical protein